ncbi:MAG TPA: AAA family ATPase, partial [Planctomycetota bacterium]|nr:AAA family ATPase [Planctomycetota bacterium]
MEESTPAPEKLEQLQGTVDLITYASENGEYVVARLQLDGGGEKIVIVGAMMSLRPGEHLRVYGQWTTHRKFGRQFKVERFEVLVPTSIPGLIKYLGSGLIRGIGPELAKRIVAKFGMDTLDILNADPERLQDVPGIGPKTYQKILQSWRKQAANRETLIFLEGYGLGPGLSARVIEAYGASAIPVVKENPYRLARDVSGIGFKTADGVAQNMGFALESPERVQAGVLFTLEELAGDGHSCYAYAELIPAARQVLGVKDELICQAVDLLSSQGLIVIDDSLDGRPVYLRKLYHDEVGVGTRLTMLSNGRSPLGVINTDAAIQWVQERQKVELAESQKRALAATLASKVSVITGGPGVGKTTIVNCIIPILRAKKLRVALAAPTGRAAKRLSEATSRDAATIHRMLKFNPRDGQFACNESTPLDADAVIVDEASMIDVNLMHHLLSAIPRHAMLVLVGDVDQLPPVGPGDVLREIIDSGVATVSRLEEVFRQARRSMIIVNAHRVNHGEMPLL